jgi:hypothetical protein
MKQYRKNFGIWVPDRSMTDNRGFISAMPGVLAGARRRSGAAPSYILSEDFESGSSSALAGWTNYSAVWNYTPALVGSYSLATNGAWTGARSPAFSADQSDFWIFMHVKASAGSADSLLYLLAANNSEQGGVSLRNDRINIGHGAVGGAYYCEPIGAESVLWLHYIAQSGGGGNGTLTLYININSSSEARPSAAASITTGTGAAIGKIQPFNGGNNSTNVFDKLRVSSTEIGSNPS